MANKIQPTIVEHQRRMAEKRADEIMDKAFGSVILFSIIYITIHLIVWLTR